MFQFLMKQGKGKNFRISKKKGYMSEKQEFERITQIAARLLCATLYET